MLALLRSYLSTKNQIVCILFFSYIYDLVRTGFIQTRKRQLEILRTISSNRRADCQPNRVTTNTMSTRDLHARFGQRRPTFLRGTDFASRRRNYDNGEWLSQGHFRPGPLEDLLESTTHKDDWQTSSSARKSPPLSFNCELSTANQPKATTTKSDETLEAEDRLQAERECPLGRMPRLVRYYQHLSHFLVIVSFIKYSCLVVFDAELFGTKQSFSCVLPGRTAILPQVSPGFSFVVLLYHVLYRFYLCVIRKSFQLESFIFLLYDKQTIESVESIQTGKLTRSDNSHEANKIYAMNRLFLVKVQLRNQVIYRVKTNRNMKHWLKLKRFFNYFIICCLGNIAVWSVPLGVAVVMTVLSVENFGIIYGVCEAVIHTHRNNWSLWDGKQLVWFICDMIDSGWLLFDTSNALVWPFSAMVFCAQDLNYTIDELNESLATITSRLKQALEMVASRIWRQQVKYNQSRRLAKLLKAIEIDTLILQSEISRMLQQVNQVDEFVSKLSAFCIFVWIFTNLFIQISSLQQNKLIMVDVVLQFMQATALVGLSLTFGFIAQVNTKTRRLYAGICNLVALDPNHKTTKSSWLCVLESFNKDQPSYSLRIGPFTELNLINYLKGCSWLITGALVTINLFKYKYGIEDLIYKIG